jgi:protein SCO1/2
MKQRFSLFLIVLLALGLGLAWYLRPRGPALPPGGDFTLQSKQGPVSLRQFRGKVVLLYFGYTSCPDVCPTNLTQLAAAMPLLTPRERKRTQVIFISVDPERDTPTKLASYAHFFDKSFIGITGTPQQVARVARAYGVTYKKVPYQGAMGYLVDHSSLTYVIDPKGRLRETLPHAPAREQVVLSIRHWLQDD